QVSLRSAGRFDLCNRVCDRPLISAEAVHLGNHDCSDALGLAAREHRLAILVAEVERHRPVVRLRDRRLTEVTPPDGEQLAMLRTDFRNDRLGTAADDEPPGLREHPSEPTDADASDGTSGDYGPQRGDPAPGEQQLATSPPTELIAVSPRGEFRAQ